MGWNLISFPLKPENNHVAQMMGNSSQGIESVWEYGDGTWHIYDPQNPGMSDLQLIKIDHGYWIKTNKEGVSIQINGRATPLLSWNLTNGWNLIGFNSFQRMPVEEVIMGLEGKVKCLWSYKDGAWQGYDAKNPELSTLYYMEPGMGYWMNWEPH